MADTTITTQYAAVAAYSAGFRGDDITRIVAIAEAETGGTLNAFAHNKSGATGVLQILPGTGAEFGYTESDLYNPKTAFEAAKKIVDKYGWSPWETYTTGAYTHAEYLNPAKTAKTWLDGVLATGGISGAIQDTLGSWTGGAVHATGDFVGGALNDVGQGILGAGYGLGKSVLPYILLTVGVLAALWLFMHELGADKPVIEAGRAAAADG